MLICSTVFSCSIEQRELCAKHGEETVRSSFNNAGVMEQELKAQSQDSRHATEEVQEKSGAFLEKLSVIKKMWSFTVIRKINRTKRKTKRYKTKLADLRLVTLA
ncbi:hypothetical protein AVEN_124208-1 [Araneus ventricosus]|uniref:Uncharacterized protein n=1 Tax=Araneus ventricosus TaxID=182803 RepID=A0A4Y2HU79_ARAVE|nr:hypothetical protein AVEN_124208-1 [Araneus ventricosus]